MKLTPEDAQRIEEKKVANVLRKIYQEKRTPTAREEAILSRAFGSNAAAPPAVGYVQTWDDLAQQLGVTRRIIQEWRKDPRYSAACPPDKADGRKEVAEWQRFMVRFGLKRADEQIEFDGGQGGEEDDGIQRPPPVAGSQAQWNVAIAAQEYRKKDNALGIQEGTLLVAAELEVPIGSLLAVIQQKNAQFPARVARYLVGRRDEQEVEERLRDEMDADLMDLQRPSFLVNTVDSIAATLPFDSESERLLKLVSFNGQDRTALHELIARVALEALRQLGRRALNPAPVAATAAVPSSPPLVEADAESRREGSGHSDSPPALDQPAPAEAARNAAKKRRRKARAKTAQPPAEIEASICAPPRRRR